MVGSLNWVDQFHHSQTWLSYPGTTASKSSQDLHRSAVTWQLSGFFTVLRALSSYAPEQVSFIAFARKYSLIMANFKTGHCSSVHGEML